MKNHTMKTNGQYIKEVYDALGEYLRGVVPEECDDMLIYRHIPYIYTKPIERILAPMSVHLEEEADGRYTIVANATWKEVKEVL